MKATKESKPAPSAESQEVHDHQNARKYFSQIPNIVDDSDLDPYERTLYLHYVRVGTCNESTDTTASKCHMSVGMVVKARRELEKKGWIAIGTSRYGTLEIYILDRWAENMKRYSPDERDSQDESDVHTVNQSFTTRTQRSHGETKNNHSNNQLEQPPQEQVVAAVPLKESEEKTKLAFREYQRVISFSFSATMAEKIKDEIEDVPIQCVKYAFDQAEAQNVKKWSYVQGILDKLRANGWQIDTKKNGASQPQVPRYAESWVNMSRKFDKGESLQACFDRLKREGRVESNAVMWVP